VASLSINYFGLLGVDQSNEQKLEANALEVSGLKRDRSVLEERIQGFISTFDDMRACMLDLEAAGQLSASSRCAMSPPSLCIADPDPQNVFLSLLNRCHCSMTVRYVGNYSLIQLLPSLL
jgi:hypothetical protein